MSESYRIPDPGPRIPDPGPRIPDPGPRIPGPVLLLFVVTLAAAVGVQAHEKFKIVGSIVKVHAPQLDVKAVDGAR